MIDFAPGVSNVVQRVNGKEFYAVETFHSSPFYHSPTPVFIRDVIQSVDLIKVYGISGMRALNEGVVMLNNHPLRYIRVSGRIAQYYIKQIRNSDCYFLVLDDCSGEEIVVKLRDSQVINAGLKLDKFGNYFVMVVGNCKINNQLEIKCKELRVLNDDGNHLAVQLNEWKKTFQMREKIKQNWVQFAQLDNDDVQYERPVQRTKIKQILNDTVNNTNDNESDDNDNDTKNIHIESSTCIHKQRFDNTWIPITKYKQTANLKFETQFSILLTKFLIKKSKKRFNLNEIYQNTEINKILVKKATEIFPLQKVSLPNIKIKSIMELKFEVFKRSINLLNSWKLIKINDKNFTNCSNILSFNKFILNIIESREIFRIDSVLNRFLIDEEITLSLDFDILNILILWIIKRSDSYEYWEFNESTKEWRYHN